MSSALLFGPYTTMKENVGPEEVAHQLVPPKHLYERLAQIPGYTWDQSIRPFHSVM